MNLGNKSKRLLIYQQFGFLMSNSKCPEDIPKSLEPPFGQPLCDYRRLLSELQQDAILLRIIFVGLPLTLHALFITNLMP